MISATGFGSDDGDGLCKVKAVVVGMWILIDNVYDDLSCRTVCGRMVMVMVKIW